MVEKTQHMGAGVGGLPIKDIQGSELQLIV